MLHARELHLPLPVESSGEVADEHAGLMDAAAADAQLHAVAHAVAPDPFALENGHVVVFEPFPQTEGTLGDLPARSTE